MVNILIVAGLILGAVAVPTLIFLLVLHAQSRMWWAKTRIYFGACLTRLVCRLRGHDTDSRYIAPALPTAQGPRMLFKTKLQVIVCHRCGKVDYSEAEAKCKLWLAERGVYLAGPALSPSAVRRML